MFQESQKIGSYILVKRLGRGGFGEVWLAEKRSQFFTKKVAIKLPLDDQVDFETIKHEATLWEQASGHPNVLPIIDADVYDGQVVIVSEYADGGSLFDSLKTHGKFPVNHAVELTIGILNGLEFLHSRLIIHRDIKPQNILLQGDTPRLADFGISRAMNTSSLSLTISGTDAYMAPESFQGKRNVQTDIWSVGVVLYQLLTGNLPFPQQHPMERMFAILQNEFEPLPSEIPNNLRDIINKSLTKQSENRYKSAREMVEDLKNSLKNPHKFYENNFKEERKIATDSEKEIPIDPTRDWREIEAEKQRKLKEEQERLHRLEIEKPKKFQRHYLVGISGILIVLIIAIFQLTKNPVSISNSNIKSPTPIYSPSMINLANLVTNKNTNVPNANSTNGLSAMDYFNRGYACMEKDYDCTIDNYSKAIDLKPDYQIAYFNRGIAYYSKANYDQAIKDYSKAIELNPIDSDAYYSRGLAYYDKKSYDQAIKDYTKAIELKPDYASAYVNRGVTYEDKKEYDQAIADYRMALVINPNSKNAKTNLDSLLKFKNGSNNSKKTF